MGSKRKIASKIIDRILDDNPSCKYFFDLFGGGGAISFEALKREQLKRVVYNDINSGVVELLKDLQKNGVTEKYYQWVDRETFNEHKNDETWFGGLCSVAWSFGNNGEKGYIYGRHLENIKKQVHFYLMENGYNGSAKKRIELVKQFTKVIGTVGPFQIENLARVNTLDKIKLISSLEIQNLSYHQVVIGTPKNETVIYIDPPYKGKEQYSKKINHDDLLEFIKSSSYKIYVSEYQMPLREVTSFAHRQTLSGNSQTEEKLYANF